MNFSPFAALFFCGAAFMHSNKWLLPTALLAWLISNPLSAMMQGYSAFHSTSIYTVLGFALVIGLGFLFSKKGALATIGGSLIGACVFYFVTNTASFFTDPLYAKTMSGYMQAMWTGIPGYPPTWEFFRNSLAANGLFTCLFLAIMAIPSIRKATSFQLAYTAH